MQRSLFSLIQLRPLDYMLVADRLLVITLGYDC
jgi:hypothetical protein